MNKHIYMKLLYSSIAFLLFIILIVRGITLSQKRSDKPVIWKEAIGKIDPHGYNHGTIYYRANDQLYSAIFDFRNDKAVSGEKYTLRYDVNNPNTVQIDFWNPVFESAEKTFTFPAQITKIRKKSIWTPNPLVAYAFYAAGKKFDKWVYLPPNYENLFPELEVGKYYQVECWSENLHRVVLHLDKPIKDTTNAK